MDDEKQFDEGMLTFEDRYPEEEEAPIECICGGLGLFGQYHHDQCPKFEDNSHA